jgi:hypothetical protein
VQPRSIGCRLIAIVLAASQSSACVVHMWGRPEGLTPQQYVAEAKPSQVRFWLVGSTDTIPIVVPHPAVQGDSLVFGTSSSGRVAWSQIRDLEVRRVNAAQTLWMNGLVIGVFIAAFAYFGHEAFSSADPVADRECFGC